MWIHTNDLNSGGGGAYLQSTKASLSIQSSDFIQCLTAADGGGLNLFSHSTTAPDLLEELRFISCESTPGGSHREGGALQITGSCLIAQFRNALFAHCAAHEGGAMWLAANSISTTARISFCFFHGNHATVNPQDIYFWEYTINPLRWSFTTTTKQFTVYPYHWDNNLRQDSWLPVSNSYS